MGMNNETNCIVYLTGHLKQMPFIEENYSPDIVILVERHHPESCALEHYRVVINKLDAAKILKCGFLGMMVSLRGDLRMRNHAEIIAETIELHHLPSANQFNTIEWSTQIITH